MTKFQLVKVLKRYPLLFLLGLAVLQLSGILLFLNWQSISSTNPPLLVTETVSPRPVSPPPSSTTNAAPSISPPSPPSSQAGKTATKSATKSLPPASRPTASVAAPTPPSKAMSVEQQALNQKYKAAFSSASSVDSLIEMRVAIAEGVSSLNVGSSTAAALMSQDRQPLLSLAAGTYSAEPSSAGMVLNATQLPTIVLLEPNDSGSIYLNNRVYHGRLLLVNDGGKLWAVNLVNLKQYLYSVVASEVSPSWPPEALKAQAIAARSYALTYFFKPISSLFHLGATEYYQVYSGIEREAAATNQAVDATAGEFVSYRGGIVESLYAASDDIVAEAFQGHGMSQLGALNLAEQGYTYQQILANYYPQTGIGRIVQDYE